ncbi:MAG: hypothetical protein JXI43_05810 [Tissierellales bacterium]|nr:hypothetical protein [Tissierellales bacterium]
MQQQFDLPAISCEQCKSSLALHIETKGVRISTLKIKCKQCDWEEDILEKGSETFDAGKKRIKEATSEIAKTLLKLRKTLPKDRKEWGKVVTNPKHPFTAALLVGIAILLMELSGFGIFMVITWILGNLILNPIGWLLVPLVVAVGFAFRRYFKRDKLEKLKTKLKELEQRRDLGEITLEEFETRKNQLFTEFFD